jgi:nitrite reductase/ring-hydroxylating ferredoxin subunit
MSRFTLHDDMTTWKLADVRAPEPGHAIRVTLDGSPVAVFRVGPMLLAIDARCTHVGGPLERGVVSGGMVTCPWHGSQFDLERGTVRRGPATQPVRAYHATVGSDGLVIESV